MTRRSETRGVKSYPSALEKGIRSERALKLAVPELSVRGVWSGEVAPITEPLCGPHIQLGDGAAAGSIRFPGTLRLSKAPVLVN